MVSKVTSSSPEFLSIFYVTAEKGALSFPGSILLKAFSSKGKNWMQCWKGDASSPITLDTEETSVLFKNASVFVMCHLLSL